MEALGHTQSLIEHNFFSQEEVVALPSIILDHGRKTSHSSDSNSKTASSLATLGTKRVLVTASTSSPTNKAGDHKRRDKASARGGTGGAVASGVMITSCSAYGDTSPSTMMANTGGAAPHAPRGSLDPREGVGTASSRISGNMQHGNIGAGHYPLSFSRNNDGVFSLPSTLYLEDDNEHLSPYQCLLRQQIEAFEAGVDDVQYNASRMNRGIVLHQVGLRCRHCASSREWERANGAVYYPGKNSLWRRYSHPPPTNTRP